MAKPEAEVAAELQRAGCADLSPKLGGELAHNLTKGEAVVDAIAGDNADDMAFGDRVLLVATPFWALVVREWIGGLFREARVTTDYIHWRDVQTSQSDSKDGYIALFDHNGASKVRLHIKRSNAQEQDFAAFCEYMQERVIAAKSSSSSTRQAGNLLIEQLERLASLRERGAISEAEFDLAKRKLLGT